MADKPRKVPGRPQPAKKEGGGVPHRPARPAKAKAKPQSAAPRPAQAATAAQQATNQSRQDQARQAAQAEHEEELEEEEGDTWNEVLKQSPSWLASMVFHMILLLVLALLSFDTEIKDNLQELVVGETDLEEIDDLEEEVEELEEPLDTDVDTPTEETVEDVVAPMEFEVDAAEPSVETSEADLTMAAAQVEISDFGMESVMSGDVLADLSGLSASGLGGSRAAGRKAAVKKSGGNASTEAAVEAALKWLADHQNRNGSWSWGYTPGDKCSGYDNPGNKKSKMGPTGLALLPFLGAGYTHHEGKYQEVVEKGLRYLVGNMVVKNNMGKLFEEDGDGHEHMYCHGIAACALVEAYGMTQDSKLRAPAQLGINYIIAAQHPENGGWLYKPRQGGDTSVYGWQVMALKSAVLSNIKVPGHVKALSNRWLDIVQYNVPTGGGYGIGSHYGYRKPADQEKKGLASTSCSAIGLLCRMYLGAKKEDPGMQAGVQAVAKRGPGKQVYFNYYGAMLMYQADGPDGEMWKKWNLKMRDMLVNAQVKQGKDKGSWFLSGGGHGGAGGAGGRVYDTAMCAMTLEVYYRYMPIYQKENVEQDDFPLE